MKHKIGYHAINWDSEPDVHRMLCEISAAEYDGVELCHSAELLGRPEQLNALLHELGLCVPAINGVSQLIGKTAEADIQVMKERIDYGARVRAEGFVPVAAQHSRRNIQGDEYRELAGNLNVLTDYAAGHGILLTVHNHMGYLPQTKEDFGILFEASSKVHVALDTAHCALAGDSCIEVIRCLGKRIGYVHLKDFLGGLPAGGEWKPADFAELGQGAGAIDLPAVLTELEASGYKGWYTVELDSVAARRPPAESARMSREYLRRLGY